MSDKIWYIYEQDHHVGPFGGDEIGEMFEQGRIQKQTMIWKEGQESWIALEECEQFVNLLGLEEELPPPLPPLPSIEDDFELEEEQIDEEEFSEDEKTDEIKITLPEEPEDHGDFETFGKYQNESNGPISRFNWKKIGKWSLGVISLAVVLLGIIWFVWNKEGERPSFQGLTPKDQQRLLQTILSDTSRGTKVAFALAIDGNQLWMGSNQQNEAQLYLRLQSHKGKILSSDQVMITTSGFLRRGVVSFSNFKMEKGVTMVPGAYSVEIYGHFTGLRSKVMTFIKELKVFNFLDYFGKYSNEFKVKGDFLLISGEKSFFESKLKDFLTTLHSKKIKPLQDMIERYRTYTALLGRTISIYQDKLKKYRTAYSVVKAFEKDYAAQIAPLLEFVLLDNNKIHVYLVDAEAVIANEYQTLLNFGKQVGEFVSDISTVTKKYRQLSVRRKKMLDQQFSERAMKLEQISGSRLSKLEQKLQRWKMAMP